MGHKMFARQSRLVKLGILMITGLIFSSAVFATSVTVYNGNTDENLIPINTPLTITSLYGKFMTTDTSGNVSQESFSSERHNVWTIEQGYARNRYLITTQIQNDRYCLQGSSDAGKVLTNKCERNYLFWQFIPLDDGTYLIMQDYQGSYLASPMASVAGKVSLTGKASEAQQWKITKHSNFKIESVSNGTLVSAQTESLEITQNPRSALFLQNWHLQLGYNKDVYRIQTINNLGEEMCLRAEGWDMINGNLISTNHVTASRCYGANLYWRLLLTEKGTYNIRDDAHNLNLTAPAKEPDRQLILTEPTTNSNQHWKMAAEN